MAGPFFPLADRLEVVPVSTMAGAPAVWALAMERGPFRLIWATAAETVIDLAMAEKSGVVGPNTIQRFL